MAKPKTKVTPIQKDKTSEATKGKGVKLAFYSEMSKEDIAALPEALRTVLDGSTGRKSIQWYIEQFGNDNTQADDEFTTFDIMLYLFNETGKEFNQYSVRASLNSMVRNELLAKNDSRVYPRFHFPAAFYE